MTKPLTLQAETPFDFASLIYTAQAQTNLSGLSEILRLLAEAIGACACILWRCADFESEYLFALAQWSSDGQTSDLHYLPRVGSATGAAVSSGQIRNVPDLGLEDVMNTDDSLFTRARINNFCSAPLQFQDGIEGAINFYRNVAAPFSQNELRLAQQASALVPPLYQIIRDAVGLSLFGKINDLLREESSSNTSLETDGMKAVMHSVCRLVRDTFQCLEVSIFLCDRSEAPEAYDLFATTWPEEEEFPRDSYQRFEDSLTGWVLSNAEAIRVFDLTRFEEDKIELRQRYPNLVWQDSLKTQTAFRRLFGLKPELPLPPLSYMAAPIVRGDSVCGVIRGCGVLKGPFYFGDKELELLKLVARQIGYHWSNWLGRRELNEENIQWRDLVKGVTNLNSFVEEELARTDLDEERIFAETLNTIRAVLRGADTNDIRLFDEEGRKLKFVAFDGKGWNEGSQSEIASRKNRVFSVDEEPPTSAGAYVFQTGRVYLIPDVEKNPYYSTVFPEIKRKIVAPIGVKSKVYGVLDIGGRGPRDFPRHAQAIAQLIGQQLGLYHVWAEAVRNFRTIEKQQIQAFEDMEHQLKSPVNLAYNMVQSFVRYDLRRLQLMFGNDEISGKLTSRLLEVRGLNRKANRVTRNMRLFTHLARNRPIPLRPKQLNYEVLVKVLIDAAKDSTLMFDPARRITSSVEARSFEILNTIAVQGDQDLIEQAVMNLLDNAVKYSFPKTTVRIYAEHMRKGQFSITVANIGIPIRANEAHLARQRGWRSEKAEWNTGEGSGLGLWIVDHIMKAHNGELLVFPTTTENITEVKLLFRGEGAPLGL